MSHAMLVLLTATHNMPDYRTLRQFACATMRRLSSIHTLMIGWPGVTSRPRSSYAVCVYKYNTCLQHLFIASLLCPEMGAAGPTFIFPCLTLTLLVLTNKLVPLRNCFHLDRDLSQLGKLCLYWQTNLFCLQLDRRGAASSRLTLTMNSDVTSSRDSPTRLSQPPTSSHPPTRDWPRKWIYCACAILWGTRQEFTGFLLRIMKTKPPWYALCVCNVTAPHNYNNCPRDGTKHYSHVIVNFLSPDPTYLLFTGEQAAE